VSEFKEEEIEIDKISNMEDHHANQSINCKYQFRRLA